MADETSAPAGEGEGISVEQAVAAFRKPPPDKPDAATSDEPDVSAAETELGDEPDAAQPDKAATSESEEETDPAEPSLDLPRSWTKEQSEHWSKLDRATQEFLLEHDRKLSSEVRNRQNEAAEIRKAAEAERQAAEQARRQYEDALPVLLNSLQSEASHFQDIQTWEDLAKMQQDDPIRYQQWDLFQKKTQAVQSELQNSQLRRQHEETEAVQRFMIEETQKFLDAAPEFSDPKHQARLATEAKELFADVGVPEDELRAIWQGQPIRIHDHRVQLIIRDAMRYRAAQKAVKHASTKPVSPVQRPGTATNKGEARSAQVEQLANKLNRTGSVDDALALWKARRRA